MKRLAALKVNLHWDVNFPQALLAVISCLLFACSPYWTGTRYVTTPAGARLCARHHIPLVRTTAYGAPGVRNIDPSLEVLQAARDLPNVLLVPTIRQPPFYTESFKPQYCPECQRIFEHRLGRLDRSTTVASHSCNIYFDSAFRHDRVIVFIDDVRVFARQMTSDEVLGFAAGTTVAPGGAQFSLRIDVPARGVSFQRVIDLTHGRYLHIFLDPRRRELTLLQQKTIPTYE